MRKELEVRRVLRNCGNGRPIAVGEGIFAKRELLEGKIVEPLSSIQP